MQNQAQLFRIFSRIKKSFFLRLGYPDNLVFKLHERRAKSRFAMEKIEEAKEVCKYCKNIFTLSDNPFLNTFPGYKARPKVS